MAASLLLLLLLFVPPLGVPSSGPGRGSTTGRVLVPRARAGVVDELRARGRVLDALDYGAYVLVELERPEALLAGTGLRPRRDFDHVWLGGRDLDTRRPAELRGALEPGLVVPRPDGRLPAGAGLYVVQFVGPPRDGWLDRLRALGGEPFQYVPANAYLVRAAPSAVARLDAWRASGGPLRLVEVYEPALRLSPGLRARIGGAGEPVAVAVQLVEAPGAELLAGALRAVCAENGAGAWSDVRVGPYRNLALALPSSLLRPLAFHPLVVRIEERAWPQAQDERHGLILGGSVSGANVVGPGYIAWLNSQGFDDTQFDTFAVNVVDSFISLQGHPDLPASRILFEENPTNQTGFDGGHGFFDAHVLAGFNDQTGTAFEDVDGFHYGLGVVPWAMVGATAIFGPGPRVATTYERVAYSLGARLSTNSYILRLSNGTPIRLYDMNAQEADFLVRDAQVLVAGNQQYPMTFAAGNAGPTPDTIGSPGTAKNVITVGASENDRPFDTDGCLLGPDGADDVRDLNRSTSNGPVNPFEGDGRWKPDIVAPGTHIQAGIPQSAVYTGNNLCNQYYPPGQTLYTWSSGTSHSTPAVAGGVALVRQFFLNQGLAPPSPALTKAVLLGSAEYMTGELANDTLPSTAQGMGRMNLGRAFDGASRVLLDQSVLFTDSGESYTCSGDVVDPALPFRVTLAWSDAPGAASASPWVNDLDLTVDVNGTTYLGNVFSGADSIPGGTADFKNNVESVFLPAGTSGPFTVTVTATTIAGDGVPQNGEPSDQDFALVVYNGAELVAPTAVFTGASLKGGVPLSARFQDASTGSVTSWSWDFGDGGTSTEADPTHVYTKGGVYSVSLTVAGPLGEDTVVRTDLVRAFEKVRERIRTP